jgi:acyl carrier protein
MTIKEEIITILKKYASESFNMEALDMASNIKNDLGINSARIIDIIIDVEESFDIEIDNRDVRDVKTLQDIITLVEAKKK